MKNQYLEEIKEALQDLEASKEDIKDILNDISGLYDDALEKGKTDEEIYALLGNPREVAYELIDTIKIRHHRNKRNKVVALMPFLATIAYMILGFGFDLWHPGWLVYLSIPISGIVFNTNIKNAIISLSPFVAVITYLILGFRYNLWHPGWLIFFLIPVISIILNTRFKDMFVALSPFAAVITFMILGTYYDLWNPGWLVFLIIPMLGLLHSKSIWKMIISELSFIIAIAFYLYMGYVQGSWALGALGFLLPIAVSMLFGDVTFNFFWNVPKGADRKKVYLLLSTILFCIVTFVALGFFLQGWAYAWQVFLLIPVVSILAYDKFRFTSISPFVAVVLFFSIGYFFHSFHLSWLAFLIIPMAGIIENA